MRQQRTFYLTLVGLSLLLTATGYGPLRGTFPALVLAILTQIYLPGLLLARAAGKLSVSHPITRFTWVLACGIGLATALGGLLRLLHVPVPVYLGLLHGLMAALALWPIRPSDGDQTVFRLRRESLPLYALLLLCCALVSVVGWERNHFRYDNYEDQTVFISDAEWLANNPDNPGLRARRAGVTVGDPRTDTDGWTYAIAAWTRASGYPAADTVWYAVTPLFGWTIPLVIFALAYELTRRTSAGVWSAAALVIVGLLTIDGMVYNRSLFVFGQFALFQLNTLRSLSRALMLPLALFVALMHLRAPRWRNLGLVFLTGAALMVMHPQQVMVYDVSIGATAGLWWLARPSRARLFQGAALLLVLVSFIGLPYLQRAGMNFDINAVDENVDTQLTTPGAPVGSAAPSVNYFLTINHVPVLGTTYILRPEVFFYHPIVALACIIGLLAGLGWRRSLAAQYLFASTAITLLLLFTPGLTRLFARLTYSQAVPGMIFALPLALAFGLAVDWMLATLTHPLSLFPSNGEGDKTAAGVAGEGLKPAPTAENRRDVKNSIARSANYLLPLAAAGWMLITLLEPFPLPVSARDQIYASNQMQATRDIHPFDQQYLADLRSLLPADTRSVVLAPNRNANYIIESVPHTIITGGRYGTGNSASYRATARFYGDGSPPAPWLDSDDLAFIDRYKVTHIVVAEDDTRLPQMLLQPNRFEYLGKTVGYRVFRVLPGIQPNEADERFKQMNAVYGGLPGRRWGHDGFSLTIAGDDRLWRPFEQAWAAALEQQPGDETARLGLAFATTMRGDDAAALPLWEQLEAGHSDVFAYHQAVASTRRMLGLADGAAPLVRLLNTEGSGAVLAARELLSETFFYQLSAEQIQQIIVVSQAYPLEWDQLVEVARAAELPKRVSLLMFAGQYAIAEGWLTRLQDVEWSPQDLTAAAALDLVQGKTDAALARLEPALDADWRAAKVVVHPDRWENNTAAQMYYLLRGGLAERAGKTNEAVHDYAQAGEAGQNLSDRLTAKEKNSNFPMLSPLVLADTHALYAGQPTLSRTNANESSVSVSAYVSQFAPRGGYPPQIFSLQLASPEGRIYAQQYATYPAEPDVLAYAPTLASIHVALRLPPDVPLLAPALLSIQPRYSDVIAAAPVTLPVVLNRPPSVEIPKDAVQVNATFGESIRLKAVSAEADADQLQITLYWQSDTPPPEDYQVFVHVLDADGKSVGQADSAPVDNRYPTSQWKPGAVIADARTIKFDTELKPGTYNVWVGLYRLPDGSRLPVRAEDAPTADNSLRVYTFKASRGHINWYNAPDRINEVVEWLLFVYPPLLVKMENLPCRCQTASPLAPLKCSSRQRIRRFQTEIQRVKQPAQNWPLPGC
jgi:tetratricopeptide (TPR) repeat protein